MNSPDNCDSGIDVLTKMDVQKKQNLIRPELYFLLQKFLSESPLQETYKILSKELKEKKILPTRIDWEGEEHVRTYTDLERLYPHISGDHLLEICSRIGPILDKEIPPCVKGVNSLLGSGKQSLLRTADSCFLNKCLRYYATRKHGMPTCDPYLIKTPHNIVNVLIGREFSGPVPRIISVPPRRYSHLQLQRQTLGHLSAVYCLLFDHSGRFIITGADDLLIKLWSAQTGKLLSTFRGASAEITDIDINLENTLIAAGSMDRILRVWSLQTGVPVAILVCHTGSITSVNFCPSTRWDLRYLVTTSSDGSVAFWTYSHDARYKSQFVSKPILYQEKIRPGQSQMICSAFSPGGSFLAAGSADHHVRVYLMKADEGPKRILETEAHSDRVDSIVWAHKGLRFVSGSKDGTAFIWHFERQQWKNLKLCMSTKLPNSNKEEQEEAKKLYVTMVAWDFSDDFIITAASDNCLKVWRSSTGVLERILTGHTGGIYVLESHPKDPYVILSSCHDGKLFIWDVLRGDQIAYFKNEIDTPADHSSVFDAKWSPDGTMFAASDSHGHITIYGFGTGNPHFKLLPRELFFHTDYRPLVRDADHVVLDEQTQIPPHLMPPPFLVDVDGNPYPPMLQKLVPGRQNCSSEQLVPNIVIGTGGRQEVIQGISDQEPRPEIDRMIAALVHRQFGNDESDDNPSNSSNLPRSIRNGPRRSGDVEGVRQSTGDWQQDPNIVWSKNLLVPPLKGASLGSVKQLIESLADIEDGEYYREIKRRPLMINTASTPTSKCNKRSKKPRSNGVPTRRTRANPSTHESENDQDVEESNNTSSNNEDSSAKEEDMVLSDSSSDSDESSGYSDWVADQGVNLEPPTRLKRKSAHRKVIIDEGDDDDEEVVEKNLKNESSPGASTSKSKPNKKKRIIPPKVKNGEVADIYKALDWLSETVPRKAPYYPQMGDEVVYFMQGHQMYVNAVKSKKVYNVNNRDLPWTKHNLRDHEFVKIIGIKYEIRPPRLCCLKLALLDGDNHVTENVFTIKYHDMADVLDFFVLKQTYETAISRVWNPGDVFRCMIEDGWWMGKVSSKSSVSEEYPESDFMCYEIQWDNGEHERMSPWDMEPTIEDRMPSNVGEAVLVLPDEIQSILYQPTKDEWPRGGRDATCKRIIVGLDKVMALAIAEPFLAPVDFNLYPTYAYIVEYPVDLSTIKARFENHFYRRITSAQFDVRYLATNAEKFNKPHSIIVKHARIITELCLNLMKNNNECINILGFYHKLMDEYETSCSDDEEDAEKPGPSTFVNNRNTLKTRNMHACTDWRVEAKKILDSFWRDSDSVPFRTPVDRIKHPEYYQLIDTPMDLAAVKEDLYGGNYETPLDFAKDMRLIFQNSKSFNTNKKSRIYSMTMRMSVKFEDLLKTLIYRWKRSRSKGCTIRKSSRKVAAKPVIYNSDSDNSEKENKSELNINTRPRRLVNKRYNVRNGTASTSKKTSDEDEDEDGDDEDEEKGDDEDEEKGDDDEVEEDDSEQEVNVEIVNNSDSKLRPSRQKRVSSSAPKISNSESSDECDPVTENNDAGSSDSDDSDSKPLSKYVEVAPKGSSNHKRKCVDSSTSSSSSSDSDSGIKKNLRSRNKKRRAIYDTDSDNVPLNHLINYSDDSETDKDVVTVSSRGRVRKLTERARALLRK